MTTTPNLALPYLDAAQAQKHVTHNEALRLLDALVMLAVVDRDLATPPASPTEGARYIVAASASGAWAGQAGKIAAWQDGAWTILAPRAGFLAYVADENALMVFDGSAWQAAGGGGGGGGAITALDDLTRLGVGTAADATNPFAAKLNNALWTAKTAAEGGDGTLRYKMNKETAAATLSLLMQTAYAGRAEIGLTGDDDLHVKVSPDGATWFEAIRVDRASGRLSFPATGGPRETLVASRTYYVRPDGSDANGGLADTAGGAFLTIQKAVDTACALDLSIYSVTIQVADGTYAPVVLRPYVGGGQIMIQGNTTTPANVVISATATNAVGAFNAGWWKLSGLKVQTTTSGFGVNASGSTWIDLNRVDFGAHAAGQYQMFAQLGGTINVQGNYTISGGGGAHMRAQTGGRIVANGGLTITLTGTPGFGYFAIATIGGMINFAGETFAGAAVGARYFVELNALINSASGGANYFPGNSLGSSATGGQYA